MEHRVWSAIRSVALCLGSETRWRRDCFWTRCGVAERTVDNNTGQNIVWSELSLLLALAIERCMSSYCIGFPVLEILPRDTFQFRSGLGAVILMILADLNVVPHLSLAVPSATDLIRADCAAVDAEASAVELPATCSVHAGLGSRIDAVLTIRIAKHSFCDVDLVGATGVPAYVPVAAVFQLTECAQTETTIARLRNIELNFRDPELEAEELIADTSWTSAGHQRDVQRLWELWCEGAENQLQERV